MRIKFLFIYVVAGAAFLAVSLWLVLSGGTNPKAIKAKFKLGGIMLIAWSIIATASCTKGPLSNPNGAIDGGEVMCYDPAPADYVNFSTENHNNEGRYYLAPGEYLTISIEGPTYKEYSVFINKRVPDKQGDEAIGDLLQTDTFVIEEDSYSYKHQIEYSPEDKDYTGLAVVRVFGPSDGPGTGDLLFFQWNLHITKGEE